VFAQVVTLEEVPIARPLKVMFPALTAPSVDRSIPIMHEMIMKLPQTHAWDRRRAHRQYSAISGMNEGFVRVVCCWAAYYNEDRRYTPTMPSIMIHAYCAAWHVRILPLATWPICRKIVCDQRTVAMVVGWSNWVR
jgi:hypothetical protein